MLAPLVILWSLCVVFLVTHKGHPKRLGRALTELNVGRVEVHHGLRSLPGIEYRCEQEAVPGCLEGHTPPDSGLHVVHVYEGQEAEEQLRFDARVWGMCLLPGCVFAFYTVVAYSKSCFSD